MAFPSNPIYKLYKHPISGKDNGVCLSKDGKIYAIPFNEDNTDYQEYLEWAKTNTPDPAD